MVEYGPDLRTAREIQGPCLLGIFLNILLYGVVLVQAQVYYSRYPEDRLWIKIYVCVLILANTLNSAFNITWIYKVLVNDFGNFQALTRADWLQASQHAFCGIVSMMAQLFYARRIWILIRNPWLVSMIVATSCVSGLAAIGSAIAVGMRPSFSDLPSFKSIGLIWLISCTICDISIATILSVYLSRQKTGIKRTDNVLKTVIRSTVSNGLLTASFTIGHIVSWLSTPLGIHYIFNYGVVKLYANSVMASLNSRKDLAARASNPLSAPMVNVKDLNFTVPSMATSDEDNVMQTYDTAETQRYGERRVFDSEIQITEDIGSTRTP